MTDLFQEPEDATPLDPGERAELLQSWITNRRDLNEAEQENIVKAAIWARRRRVRTPTDLLHDDFTKALHRQMFGEVWKWAGSYRKTERNLGIEAFRIPAAMPEMLSDVHHWIAHGTYPPDEIAVRLHHRLVSIHPFANGNGRHARMLADLLIEKLDGESFSWGGGRLADVGTLRARYIAALQAADGHDIRPLLVFARS